MTQLLRNMWMDDNGQDVAEYALMLTLILLVALLGIQAIGTNAGIIFNNVAAKLTTP